MAQTKTEFMIYETVIGLEVHVQLDTASKMFCSCSTRFGSEPNTQVCPVCLGFPGVLPVINRKALQLAVKTALALNCKIAGFTKFDRKHYYYPDLPKNYQISQYDRPLSYDGFLEIDIEPGRVKKINLKRIHLEEDAGKLVHQEAGDFSLVDYNRAGTPLLEIVTQPDLNSSDEAYAFLEKLKLILQYLEVSDCNMEEGSLRCDANISLRPVGQKELGTKTEVKNMNSFKAVRAALAYEAKRQRDLLSESKKVMQETRLWDSNRFITASMRSKEEAHDYRYFPDPDLMPIIFSKETIDEIKKSLPEMPHERKTRFIDSYKLSAYDAEVLTKEKRLADFFEATLKDFNEPKTVANWITVELAGILSATGLMLDQISLKPADLTEMLKMVKDGLISGKMGKEILRLAVETKKKPADIVKEKGLSQITDIGSIENVITKILSLNPEAIADYNSGKENALTFLIGQIMKETKGKASPNIVNKLLKERLAKGK